MFESLRGTEGKPGLIRKLCAFCSDRSILNSLRHSINSVRFIKSGAFSLLDPIVVPISIFYVVLALFVSTPLTQFMQQVQSRADEYSFILPSKSLELFQTNVAVWLTFAVLIQNKHTWIGSNSMRAYLSVADFYFKTSTIY